MYNIKSEPSCKLWASLGMIMVSIYVFMCIYVCVCVCVCERCLINKTKEIILLQERNK